MQFINTFWIKGLRPSFKGFSQLQSIMSLQKVVFIKTSQNIGHTCILNNTMCFRK